MSTVSRDRLTDEQKAVVESTEPTVLVLGGAGCGKTTTALWAAKHSLESVDSTPSQVGRVLFLTFSRTAVARIAERSGDVFAGAHERVEIMTFHGFAYRLLRDFGRYFGHGTSLPSVRSSAESRLLGNEPKVVDYDSLLRTALQIFGSPLIASLLKSRWSLVICDEFQDTSTEQWKLLETLGSSARLLLLADPDQMIYTFIPGVQPQRISQAASRPSAREITLQPRSFRDETQVIPLAAGSILRRQFNSAHISTAAQMERLTVRYPIPDDESHAAIVSEILRLRKHGMETIGVFLRTNEAAEALGPALAARRIPHVPIGLTEANGLALHAQVTLLQTAVGAADWGDVATALAVFLTSLTKGKKVPAAALALHLQTRFDSRGLEARVQSLRACRRPRETARRRPCSCPLADMRIAR